MGFLDAISDFYIVMSKVNSKNKSYTDFLLAACLYHFQHAKVALLTTDLGAFPPFFPRSHIVTIEHANEVVNFGFYKFHAAHYAQAATKALEEVK